ncbi:MAG: hypothetical protein R3E32_24000 [Chitinophagales bacterium]
MTDYHKIYLQLKEKYTDEEIADFAMIPADSTTEEAQKGKGVICSMAAEKTGIPI